MPECVLITGATGFLGSYLTHALLDNGYMPVVLKRKNSDKKRIADVIDEIRVYDTDEVEKAFSEQHISAVFHTACSYGRNGESYESIIQSNVLFGIKLLETAIRFKVETFFNTDTLLQRNVNSYALSKKQFSEWLKNASDKIQVINLRIEHMYGKKDGTVKFVPWLIEQLENNVPEIKLTSGIQKRDIIYISDIVSAFLLLLEKRKCLGAFSEFDVGTGQLVSVRDFVESLYAQYQEKHQNVSTKLLFGAVPYWEGEQMEVKEDVSPLKSLGWKTTVSYVDGIKKLLEP